MLLKALIPLVMPMEASIPQINAKQKIKINHPDKGTWGLNVI